MPHETETARDRPQVSVVIINKNEPALADTLRGLGVQITDVDFETVVVDASEGRLDNLRQVLPQARWMAFRSESGKTVTIPEQRNVGVRSARGDVIAFIDAGCTPRADWLEQLVAPILVGREQVTAGRTLGNGDGNVYTPLPDTEQVLEEAPTINLAFSRAAFDDVGGFDEDFDYGSDIDFTWRLRHAGHRVLLMPSAVVTHDWGDSSRQLKRAWRYGQARARIYHKHRSELVSGLRRDPILFVYPAFLLLLPATLHRRLRWFPLLVLLPLWRARDNRPFMTVADHLAYGVGALSFLVSQGRGGDRR